MNQTPPGVPVRVELQNTTDASDLPDPAAWGRWIVAAHARAGRRRGGNVTVRIVGRDESGRLNATWRQKVGATNVMAFAGPAHDTPVPEAERELGDLVICMPVVLEEARDQGKAPEAHMAHMAVHGTLHLLGFDHGDDTAAADMEALESKIMRELGYADPYEER